MLFGLLVSSAALFFPWYSDVDTFGTGVQYSAVNGPASMIGITLLIINLVTASLIAYAARFRKEPSLPINRAKLEKWGPAIYLYSIFILTSYYFHPDFGINVADKAVGYGLYGGLAGAVITGYSAWVLKKQILDVENASYVGEVAAEDPKLKAQWEKQKEIEDKLMGRQHEDISSEEEAEFELQADEIAEVVSEAIADELMEPAVAIIHEEEEGTEGYTIRTDL